jgi:hypothetical protein
MDMRLSLCLHASLSHGHFTDSALLVAVIMMGYVSTLDRRSKEERPKELVALQKFAASNAYEIAALVAVLERKGLITHPHSRLSS